MANKYEDIPIGTKIELNVVDPVQGKLNINFISQIENFKDENIIIISAPIFEAKVFPVRVNSKVEAYAYRGDHLNKIVGFIENRLFIDGIAVLEVRVVESIQRIQRRRFFRFDCSVPVVFYEKPEANDQDAIQIAGRTLNLSGGGLLAITDKPLTKGLDLPGQIWLGNDTSVEFNGKVIRCASEVINEELKYISSIGFIDIGYKQREMIVGYIFDQQRILLKKGLR